MLPPERISPPFQSDRSYAQYLDGQDVLSHFRGEFAFVEDANQSLPLLYFDGNSLGRLPRRTMALLTKTVEKQWGERLVRAWAEDWYQISNRVGEKIAPWIGAGARQVLVGDSTSVNLYKLVMAALKLRPERKVILTDELNFSSDLYILQGCVHILGNGYTIRQTTIADAFNETTDPTQAILQAMDSDTALVTLSHVAFKSGYRYDAAAITQRAHALGILVLWDISHSVGAVPLELDTWQVDFAVGCTYKYLNGGPGAPAFLYVREDLQDQILSPIWGWFGSKQPFAFSLQYQSAPGIQRFLSGTPSILSLAAVESGVDLLTEAGMERLYAKSAQLSAYFLQLMDVFLAPLGFTSPTPRVVDQRGSHVSIRHAEGYRINRALIAEMNVLPDFREPDLIRLGFTPIYTQFREVWDAVQRIAFVVQSGSYRKYPTERLPVT